MLGRALTSCTSRWSRATQVLLAATFLACAAVSSAAGPLEDARAAWQAGDAASAERHLLDYLVEEDDDPERILAAVRLATRLGSLDLIERAQGRAEIAAADRQDARLELAMGLAYLALGDGRLRAGASGPTLAMLFADAEARATKVMTTPAWAPEGRVLFARTRHAVGDLGGAIAGLLDGPPATAREHHWAGRLLYERGLASGDAAAMRADLHAALDHLREARPEEDLEADEAFLGRLTTAWIAHRLALHEPEARDAWVEAALDAYREAWRRDPTSPLPLRGLASLKANEPGDLAAALEAMLAERPEAKELLDALVRAWLDAKDGTRALLALQRRIAVDERDPTAWILGGRIFVELEQWREARKHLARALQLDPRNQQAAGLMDALARTVMAQDAERGIDVYEELLRLRPADPYVRNNYAFLLRDLVSPHTTVEEDGVQTLGEDAPPRALELLRRCRDVYAEAASAIPEAEDGQREEMEAWNLAGIVNDYGLVLHYFADIQDATEAERQYRRALRMTEHGFKDTFYPNLVRLYTTVLPDRELALLRAAREARYAILREAGDEAGRLVLVPDEEKRALAAELAAALRERIREELDEDDD